MIYINKYYEDVLNTTSRPKLIQKIIDKKFIDYQGKENSIIPLYYFYNKNITLFNVLTRDIKYFKYHFNHKIYLFYPKTNIFIVKRGKEEFLSDISLKQFFENIQEVRFNDYYYKEYLDKFNLRNKINNFICDFEKKGFKLCYLDSNEIIFTNKDYSEFKEISI